MIADSILGRVDQHNGELGGGRVAMETEMYLKIFGNE